MKLLLLLWTFLLVVIVQADASSSEVKLSLDEFEELFSSARLENEERRLLDQRKKHEAEHRRTLEALEKNITLLRAEAQEQLQKLFPSNYQVLSYSAQGFFNASSVADSGIEHDIASFDHEIILRVMEPADWIAIPLANMNTTIASNWNVAWAGGRDGSGTKSATTGSPSPGHAVDGEGEIFGSVDTVATPDVMMVLKDTQQILATNRSGLFRIQFKAYSRVQKSKNRNQISLSNLLYPLTEFSLRVTSRTSTTANSRLVIVKDFSVEPSAAILHVTVDPSKEYTDVTANLPWTTDRIEIRWLDAVPERVAATEATKGAQKEPGEASSPQDSMKEENLQVTATAEALHSVGEGMIRSSYALEFTTTSKTASLNVVHFSVHGYQGLRITSIDGHALSHWQAHDVANATSTAGGSQFVRAVFKSSHMDAKVGLLVHTEMPSSGSAGRGTTASLLRVELPRIVCANVLRQTGHVAILKEDAHVEVHEHDKRGGLAPCEATDVSSQLRLNVDRPIVLSYRYLHPDFSLVLAIREHVAMGHEHTLEATMDRVHYKAVVTETHTLHSFLIVLQSIKLQYLQVRGLPSTATMFTLLVNSVPAKPVQVGSGNDGDNDKEHSILVPLLIGLDSEAANEGSSMRTLIELSYISTHHSDASTTALGKNGTLVLTPPSFELPISVETTHLRLPKGYEYDFSAAAGTRGGGFVGPKKQLPFPIPDTFSYQTGKRVVEQDYKFSFADDVMAAEESSSATTKSKQNSVQMVTPNMGSSYYFHRLVVVDGISKQPLNVSYSEIVNETKSWWSLLFG